MVTKANWPEKMEYRMEATNPGWTSIYLWDEDNSYQGDIIGDTKAQAEARARQICALPKMVELLKELHDAVRTEELYDDIDRGYWLRKITNILSETGEIE